MGSGEEEHVKIGLREIYDKVVQTHEAVQAYGPRLDAVENLAKEAHKQAGEAEDLSRSNSKHISAMWKSISLVAGGFAVALINAWVSHHAF